YSSICQDVTLELKKINDYHSSVSSMKYDLDIMSNHFYYYNEENKVAADELLKQILKLSETLRIHRNNFLLRVFGQLDSMQKQYVKEIISSDLKDTDLLYNELVSLYNLTSHFSHIYSKVDTLALKNIKIQFTTKGYISDYNVMQLKYISTLANLSGDTLYENKLLGLVKELYDYTKSVDDEKKRNGLLVELYNLILPNSIGLIYSRSSVINSLYLIDEPTIVKYSSDVGDSRFAWNYLMCCVIR